MDKKTTIDDKAKILGIVLNGLKSVLTDDEIIELLKPKNVRGGIKILNDAKLA